MAFYWSYDWLVLCSKWKGRRVGARNFISFSFLLFFCCCCCCCFLFVKKNCPVLSSFINFIFNSFVISYWMYFVVIERKKTKKLKKKKYSLTDNVLFLSLLLYISYNNCFKNYQLLIVYENFLSNTQKAF